jgi:hypothetical protein
VPPQNRLSKGLCRRLFIPLGLDSIPVLRWSMRELTSFSPVRCMYTDYAFSRNDLQIEVGEIFELDSGSALVPGTQQPAQEHQFTQVVGVVVGDEESFAQDGLAVAVRNFGEKVG